MKKLMSKSVLLGLVALLSVFFNTNVYTKTADAILSEDKKQTLWNLALKRLMASKNILKNFLTLQKILLKIFKPQVLHII